MYKIFLLLTCLCSAAATAQVQVVEAGGAQPPNRSRTTAVGNNSNELLVSLYNQLEALQQEVQLLRGMAEEQGHKLGKLETESRERYMDIDRRLLNLKTAVPDPTDPNALPAEEGDGNTVTTASGDVRTSVPYNAAVQGSVESLIESNQPKESVLPTINVDKLNEQDLYKTALQLLIEEGNSADSLSLFDAYIERFPEGRLMPNALYWQGEAYILLTDYSNARRVFERVLRNYPAHAKAADCMYKLGVAFNLMGERGLSEQTMRELPIRYPDSVSQIKLAQTYIDKNFN